MARRLVEQYRRRPDFDAQRCTPITLADGQEWHLPRPWTEIRPVWKDGKAVDCTEVLSCGEELDALLEAIGEADDPLLQLMGVQTLAGFLLLRSYDLEPAEIERLLTVRVGDPASEQMVKDIVDAATGKLSRVFGKGALTAPKSPGGGCV